MQSDSISIQSLGRGLGYQVQASVWLNRSLEEVFSFFSDAFNLEKLTPSLLRFEVMTPPPIVMRAGLLIDYRLRVHGLPLRWQSEISVWEPPFRFVDEQRKGPYRQWHHEHRFEAKDGGTLVTDRVTYRPPGGAWVNRLLVERDVRKIFTYRTQALHRLFP